MPPVDGEYRQPQRTDAGREFMRPRSLKSCLCQAPRPAPADDAND